MTGAARVLIGNSMHLLKEIDEASVDAVVCDPPYGLTDLPFKKIAEALSHWLSGEDDWIPGGAGFMGEAWDRFVPPPALWKLVARVLKPGGYAAVFAGSRTQDLMGMSLRLAGFEVRDALMWINGQNFPKAKGVLKSGYEPILLVRKPFVGSIKANLQRHGVGELFTEACRVPFTSAADETESKDKNRHADFGTLSGGNQVYGDYSMLGVRRNYDPPGRWPANLLLTHADGCVEDGFKSVRSGQHHPARRGKGGAGYGHKGQAGLDERATPTETVTRWLCAVGCPVAELDRQSGVSKSVGGRTVNISPPSGARVYGGGSGVGRPMAPEDVRGGPGYGDIGGASRFFYTAKASAKERPFYVDAEGRTVRHPTVKPLALIRWIAKLITPPGGLVLDCFAGSGTTGEAAVLDGFDAILIENEPVYEPLIRQRLLRAANQDVQVARRDATFLQQEL